MGKYQEAKKKVRDYFDALESARVEDIKNVLKEYMSEDYLFRGVYPFREQHGTDATAENFV